MSIRKQILESALFDTGGEADGIAFGPLSPPVLMILRRRGNILVTDGNRHQDENEALAEILFVLSRTKDERSAMFRDSAEQWESRVLEFMAGLPDKALSEFGENYLAPALQAVALAQTESEGPGKSGAAPNRATSHSSTKARGKSGSTTSQGRSERKIQSGKSACAPSCNSSSPTRSGKATVTGGSTGRNRAKKC